VATEMWALWLRLPLSRPYDDLHVAAYATISSTEDDLRCPVVESSLDRNQPHPLLKSVARARAVAR